MRQLGGAGPAGLGNGDNHINLTRWHGRDHPFGQGFAQVEPGLIHRDAVEDGIGTRQIDIFEDAGHQARLLSALRRMQLARRVDKNRLPRLQIALELMTGPLQRHRLAGHHPGLALPAQTQRPDAKGIAKRQQAVPGDQRHHRIGATYPLVYAANGSKHIGGRQGQAPGCLLQLVGQHIEQHLRVAFCVDVAVIDREKLGLQGCRVGEIAVVHQHQAERRVHIERLGLLFAVGITGGGVTHLPQAQMPWQGSHIARAKHIAHHPFGLVHEKLLPHLRDDTRSILPPMLKQEQAVIDQLVDRGIADDTKNTAHKPYFP